MMTESVHIQHATAERQLYLAFDQRATHEAALAAEALTEAFLASNPPQPTVVLDLAAGRLLDSTFAGWMLKLRRLCYQHEGRVVVSHCSTACRGTIDLLGLTALFDFEDVTPPENLQQVVCAPSGDSGPQAVEFVMQTHEHLADVSRENQETFAPVVDVLRDELRTRKSQSRADLDRPR